MKTYELIPNTTTYLVYVEFSPANIYIIIISSVIVVFIIISLFITDYFSYA